MVLRSQGAWSVINRTVTVESTMLLIKTTCGLETITDRRFDPTTLYSASQSSPAERTCQNSLTLITLLSITLTAMRKYASSPMGFCSILTYT